MGMEKHLTAAMANEDALQLGRICHAAAHDFNAGDAIDRGLILRRKLEEGGYLLFKAPAVA